MLTLKLENKMKKTGLTLNKKTTHANSCSFTNAQATALRDGKFNEVVVTYDGGDIRYALAISAATLIPRLRRVAESVPNRDKYWVAKLI